MKTNIGLADRYLRLLVAVLLAFFYFSDAAMGGWKIILLIVTCILAATAVTGICPLYSLFGLDTHRGRKRHKKSA